MSKVTPMLAQYLDIKAQYPECVLFYRVGDFYEMFYEDAVEASAILDITLTRKRLGTDIEPAPLCGVPFHAAESYLARLLSAGRKVAICDQTEDPALAKGLVRREVTRVLTPGTLTSELMLTPGKSNYLASVFFAREGIGLAYTDITTMELEAMAFEGDTRAANERALMNELGRIEPAEILLGFGRSAAVPEPAPETGAGAGAGIATEAEALAFSLKRETGAAVTALKEADFSGVTVVEKAVSGLSSYLIAVKAADRPFGGDFPIHQASGRMLVDRTAARNLELTEPMMDGGRDATLLGVLDRTKTAIGARMLKRWIREPLVRKEEIEARLDAVDFLLGAYLVRNDLREALRYVYDLERLAGRIEAGTANGRDLTALKSSLLMFPELKSALAEADSGLLQELAGAITDHSGLCALIGSALLDDQPLSVHGGGLIRDGYSPELDRMKLGISDGKLWIAALESSERERTGIKSLKVRYNRVQGYYIEITNANLGQIPDDYIRKQTLTGGERFVTPELKRIENEVFAAESGINTLEAELFVALCAQVMESLCAIREAAASIGRIDALQSLAQAAQENGYARPAVTDSDRIMIVRGRHPVLERLTFASGGAFVPNDVSIDLDRQSMLLVTGPNMAGKSTYMRQTALIVLMAQMGSFVPADSAEIGVCDRIFTRIGASDNIAREQSTFLVEMNELSEIVADYTERSLIILDEIGRGTSTYDGLAIAWAAIDYLCAEGQRARTMFATHYHELTALEGVLPGLVNLSTQIDDSEGRVVYLHKIVAGAMGRSYGIHVAKMAGLPGALIDDANEKLAALEKEAKEIRIVDPASVGRQIAFIDFSPGIGKCTADAAEKKPSTKERTALGEAEHKVCGELERTDVLQLTPAAAIALIEKLKKEIATAKNQ